MRRISPPAAGLPQDLNAMTISGLSASPPPFDEAQARGTFNRIRQRIRPGPWIQGKSGILVTRTNPAKA
jgi:hypothetical protein